MEWVKTEYPDFTRWSWEPAEILQIPEFGTKFVVSFMNRYIAPPYDTLEEAKAAGEQLRKDRLVFK